MGSYFMPYNFHFITLFEAIVTCYKPELQNTHKISNAGQKLAAYLIRSVGVILKDEDHQLHCCVHKSLQYLT